MAHLFNDKNVSLCVAMEQKLESDQRIVKTATLEILNAYEGQLESYGTNTGKLQHDGYIILWKKCTCTHV